MHTRIFALTATLLFPMALSTHAADAPDVQITRDVAYLEPGRTEKLDIYLPAARPVGMRSPGIVIIHGGGWIGGDKDAGRESSIGTTLARAGYVCVSVNYHLGTKGETGWWPGNLFDCKNAVRFLRKNAETYGVDSSHIGVIGGSAGGHLALMVALTSATAVLEPSGPYAGISDSVQAAVDLYGITNFLTLQTTDADGKPTGKPNDINMTAMLGGSREARPDLWRQASPVTYITENAPPVLIAQGLRDTTVDRDQSSELANALAAKSVSHEVYFLPGVGHTFDLQTWNGRPLPVDMRRVVTNFFDLYLKAPAK